MHVVHVKDTITLKIKITRSWLGELMRESAIAGTGTELAVPNSLNPNTIGTSISI